MSETTIFGHTIVPASELDAERITTRNSISSLQQRVDEAEATIDQQRTFIDALKKDRDRCAADLEETQKSATINYNKVYELEEQIQRKVDLLKAKEKENDELKAKIAQLEMEMKDLTSNVTTEDCIEAIEKAVADKKSRVEASVSLAKEVTDLITGGAGVEPKKAKKSRKAKKGE